MSTTTKNPTPTAIPAAVLARVIDEGHGPEAWYGADVVTAVSSVDAATAARRPSPGRHNVGEIALHHAFWLGQVRSRLTGRPADPFVLEGEDWFTWDGSSRLSWTDVKDALAREVQGLRHAVDAIESGSQASPLSPEDRFDQVLGIAGHAAYHAGQIQLVKALVS